jgi:NADH:ubiquinone oxidoreductase subunit D
MAKITALRPKGKVLYTFEAREDFADIEEGAAGERVIKSHYVKGMRYSVRDGNEQLHAKVQRWLGEKKVRT